MTMAGVDRCFNVNELSTLKLIDLRQGEFQRVNMDAWWSSCGNSRLKCKHLKQNNISYDKKQMFYMHVAENYKKN